MRQDVLAAYAGNVRRRKNRIGLRFDAATKLWFDRMDVTPPLRQQHFKNQLIRDLNYVGNLEIHDGLYDFMAHDAQAAKLNLAQARYDLTVGGGNPTFVAGSHVVGNGTTDWLDTGFNPTTAIGAKYTQDNAHLGIWSLTDLSDGGRDDMIGNNSGAFLSRTAAVPGQLTYRINQAGSGTRNTAWPGHVMVRRIASNSLGIYVAGTSVATATTVSTALTNANMRILDGGGAFSINQVRFAHFGRRFLDAKAPALYQAFLDYATRMLGAL